MARTINYDNKFCPLKTSIKLKIAITHNIWNIGNIITKNNAVNNTVK